MAFFIKKETRKKYGEEYEVEVLNIPAVVATAAVFILAVFDSPRLHQSHAGRLCCFAVQAAFLFASCISSFDGILGLRTPPN